MQTVLLNQETKYPQKIYRNLSHIPDWQHGLETFKNPFLIQRFY